MVESARRVGVGRAKYGPEDPSGRCFSRGIGDRHRVFRHAATARLGLRRRGARLEFFMATRSTSVASCRAPSLRAGANALLDEGLIPGGSNQLPARSSASHLPARATARHEPRATSGSSSTVELGKLTVTRPESLAGNVDFRGLQSVALMADKPPTAGQHLFLATTWQRIGELLGISPRELEIARHVFDDLTERQIADLLGISRHTVHTHLERLYHKLNVASRVGLLVRVFESFLALQQLARS